MADSSYDVIWIGTLYIFVKHVPPKAGRLEGAFDAGARPSQPLQFC